MFSTREKLVRRKGSESRGGLCACRIVHSLDTFYVVCLWTLRIFLPQESFILSLKVRCNTLINWIRRYVIPSFNFACLKLPFFHTRG